MRIFARLIFSHLKKQQTKFCNKYKSLQITLKFYFALSHGVCRYCVRIISQFCLEKSVNNYLVFIYAESSSIIFSIGYYKDFELQKNICV